MYVQFQFSAPYATIILLKFCQAFLKDSENTILRELARHHEFALEDLQKNAWIAQIKILKEALASYNGNAHIYTPEKEQFWPAQENLQWHSKRIFTQ